MMTVKEFVMENSYKMAEEIIRYAKFRRISYKQFKLEEICRDSARNVFKDPFMVYDIKAVRKALRYLSSVNSKN